MQSEQEHTPQGAEKHEQKIDPRTPEAMLKVIKNSSPEDIVAFERYCTRERRKNDKKEHLSDRDRYVSEIENALAAALEVLPAHDLDQAREIFKQQAESSLPRDRSSAGLNICASGIAKYDRSFVDHLDRLVRDPDDEVRRNAYTMIELTSFDSMPTAEERARALESQVGLTEQDAWRLRHAYFEAGEGRNLYDPEREAFDRVMGSMGGEAQS